MESRYIPAFERDNMVDMPFKPCNAVSKFSQLMCFFKNKKTEFIIKSGSFCSTCP